MWLLFSLLTSLINAVYYICNQNSRLPPELFMIYRGYVLALAATPIALAMFHLFGWQFYFIASIQGLLISYTDLKYFQAFVKFGAQNVASITPLTVIITFFIWLIAEPNLIMVYAQNPLRSVVILFSIILIVISVIKYRAQPVGIECFRFLWPILILISIIDSSNKLIMQYADSNLLAATVTRVALTGWIIGSINLFLGLKHKLSISDVVSLKNIKQGLFVLLLALSMISLNFSMYYAQNPAYTTAVIYLSVVWIILINYFIKNRQGYRQLLKKWIFVLLFATAVLSVAAK